VHEVYRCLYGLSKGILKKQIRWDTTKSPAKDEVSLLLWEKFSKEAKILEKEVEHFNQPQPFLSRTRTLNFFYLGN
jgi:hypothetical protein